MSESWNWKYERNRIDLTALDAVIQLLSNHTLEFGTKYEMAVSDFFKRPTRLWGGNTLTSHLAEIHHDPYE